MSWEKYIEQNKTRWMLSLPEYLSSFLIEGIVKEVKNKELETNRYTWIYLTEDKYLHRNYVKEEHAWYWGFYQKGEPSKSKAVHNEITFITDEDDWEDFEDFLEWRLEKIEKNQF